MTDIVKSPHDTLVGLVSKALNTGTRVVGNRPMHTREPVFYAGRVSAFVYAAAMLMDQMYGATFADVRHRLMNEVRDVLRSWTNEERQDAAKVGEQATLIVNRVLEG